MRIRLIKKLLLIFIVLLPFWSLPYIVKLNLFLRLPYTVELADYLFGLIFILSIPEIIRQRKVLLKDRYFWLCAAIIIYLIFNAILSTDFHISVYKLAGKSYLLSIPLIFTLYFKGGDDIKNFLKYFCFSFFTVTLLGLLAIILYYLKIPNPLVGYVGDMPESWNLPRLYIFFTSPSLLAVFLMTGGLLSYYCLTNKIYDKLILRASLAMGFITLLFTFSRNTWSFLPALGIMLFYKNSLFGNGWSFAKLFSSVAYLGYTIITLILVLLSTYFYIFPLYIAKQDLGTHLSAKAIGSGSFAEKQGYVDIKWLGVNAKWHNRTIESYDAWKAFLSHPVKGIGVGVFPSHGYFWTSVARDPHNTLLTILSQLGLLGLGLSILFLFILCLRLRSIIYSPNRELARIMFAVISVFVFSAIFTDLDDNRYLFLYIALINLLYYNMHSSDTR